MRRHSLRCEGIIGLLLCGLLAQLGITSEGGSRPDREPLRPAIDIAAEAGIAERTHSYSANVGDYDGDGWDDVLIVRHRFAPSQLFHNDHGKFTEVAKGTFPAGDGTGHDRHDCDWADVDQDDLLDVFCTIGAGNGSWTKANELWMQVEPGEFEERADDYGLGDKFGRGRSSTFIDLNHDTFPDLFIGNQPVRQDVELSKNRLFLNDGGVRFVPAHDAVVEQQIGAQTVQAIDYDNDRWQDLLICGKSGLRLYRRLDGDGFEDVSAETGALRPCQAALMADLDGDGEQDIAAAARGLTISLQRRDGFQDFNYERETERANSIAAGDFDGDGDLDLYVLLSRPARSPGSNFPDLLLINRGDGRHWRARPTPSTSEGVGDHVEAIDSDRDGRDEFIVLNGRGKHQGPVQLIAAPSRPQE